MSYIAAAAEVEHYQATRINFMLVIIILSLFAIEGFAGCAPETDAGLSRAAAGGCVGSWSCRCRACCSSDVA